VQIAKNLHAVHAAQALSKLCGLGGDGISSPSNLPAFNTLRALLTPRLADMLRNYPPKDLLSNLNSNLESPEVLCFVFNNIILNAQPKQPLAKTAGKGCVQRSQVCVKMILA
jgi:hypothetical protein